MIVVHTVLKTVFMCSCGPVINQPPSSSPQRVNIERIPAAEQSLSAVESHQQLTGRAVIYDRFDTPEGRSHRLNKVKEHGRRAVV